MTYLLLKHLHVTCVVLSISGFVMRGVWMMRESPWLQKKWVRVAPHVIDTILLGSAILLTMQIRQYPFVRGWLTAKVLALINELGDPVFQSTHGVRVRGRRLRADDRSLAERG